MPETAIIERTGNHVTAKCAFCHGTGKDPSGLLSILATCQVCRGSGKITATAPVVKYPFCNGNGVLNCHTEPKPWRSEGASEGSQRFFTCGLE